MRYRTLADQARFNAEKAVDEAGREWFLALAKTMTELADALEGHRPG
ncbi:MAG TPA: hypothetical protein VHT51_21100 [Micropepsaceae bacterium]|nr:hypothetical protein [Micropepsaceae bacterium]